jgi:hypothetical protein
MGAGTTGCSVQLFADPAMQRLSAEKTLNEEGEADHKLTGIAERQVNVAAAHA